jgi:predicted MFS family arabinose efflux permease
MTQQVRPHWPAVFSIAAGIFVIVTTEIMPIGLLVPISGAFAVSTGTAGLMMTVPGLVAAVAAPVATVATARVDRRTMLGVWMVTLVGANVVCAVATSFWMLLTALGSPIA